MGGKLKLFKMRANIFQAPPLSAEKTVDSHQASDYCSQARRDCTLERKAADKKPRFCPCFFNNDFHYLFFCSRVKMRFLPFIQPRFLGLMA